MRPSLKHNSRLISFPKFSDDVTCKLLTSFVTTNERERMGPNLNMKQNLSPINPKSLKAMQNTGDFSNPFINVQKMNF